MSFVLRAFSATGKLQLHEDFPSPQFMGRIVTVNNNIISQQGGEFGYEMRSYSGTAPNFYGRDVIIFWSLPQGVQWLMPATYEIAAATGAEIGCFAFCAPGTVISGAPIGYVFALGAPIQSTEQFCARAWDAGGNLIFDSGIPTLSPHQAPAVPTFVPGQTNTVTLDRPLPANPAFLMPYVTRDEENYDGYLNTDTGLAHKREWWGTLQHGGGVVQVRFPLVQEQDQGATNQASRAGYYEIQTYGNSAGLVLPIINASTYD